MQDIITANIEERIQDLLPLQKSAQQGYVNSISVTANLLIQNSKTDEDFVPAAAMIYSNIEENLIYKYKLPHQDKKFVIDVEEYNLIADTTKIGDRFILKRINEQTGEFERFSPRIVEYIGDSPKLVEMPPIVRFIKAGLSALDAKKASDFWTVLNKIRHRSPDNENYLSHFFNGSISSKREYMMEVLNFFKECGLYSKE